MRKNANVIVGLFLIAFFLMLWVPGLQNPVLAKRGAKSPFRFEDVIREARTLSAQPYKVHKDVPDSLLKMEYDQWRDIRFKPDHAFWHQEGLPFTLQFFHAGLFYDRTVSMSVVDPQGGVLPIPFSKDASTTGVKRSKRWSPTILDMRAFASTIL